MLKNMRPQGFIKNGLFALLGDTISKERIRRNTEELHRLEGNESNSNFKASTDFALKMMKESGFQQTERIVLPADGKTRYFDCIMPLAWDSCGRSFIRLEDERLSYAFRMRATLAEHGHPGAGLLWAREQSSPLYPFFL